MKPKTVGRASGQIQHSGLAPEGVRAEYEIDGYELNGLLPGTRLLTLEGEMPADYLSPGDRIITRDVGMAVLRDVRVTEVWGEVVRVKAGSLGHTSPEDDMTLPATQRVLIRDWRAEALFGMKSALVPVARLVDGQFVSRGPREKLRLVQLRFDAPHILYADGLEVESSGALAEVR